MQDSRPHQPRRAPGGPPPDVEEAQAGPSNFERLGLIGDPTGLQVHGLIDQARAFGNQAVQDLAARLLKPGPRSTSPGGRPLPDELREKLEASLGTDLSGIRVHLGSQADASTTRLGARAFATGGDVIVHASAWAPGTPDGDRRIAEEVVHTLQLGGRGPGLSGATEQGERPSSPASGAEHQARSVSRLAALGQQVQTTWALASSSLSYRDADPDPVTAALGRLHAAITSRPPNHQAIVGELSQGTPRVQALSQRWRAAWSTDLVATLREACAPGAFRQGSWDVVSALLIRAGLSVPGAEGATAPTVQPGADARQLRIVAEPEGDAVMPGTHVRYRVQMPDMIMATGSGYQYTWWCVNDPASVAAAPGRPAWVPGPQSGVWDAEWGFEGNHKLLCRLVFRTAEGREEPPIVLERTVAVRSMAARLQGALNQAQPPDFLGFRSQLALQEVMLSRGAPEVPRGQGTGIRTETPNPVAPAGLDSTVGTYRLDHPPEGSTRLRWYAIPDRVEGMPTQQLYEGSRTTWRGQPAYALGEGPQARFTLAMQGTWTIACEAIGANDQPVGPPATYRQVVVSSQEMGQITRLREFQDQVDTSSRTIADGKRVGLRAAFVSQESGQSMTLSLWAGPGSDAPGTIRLIDLTPGASRIAYEGRDIASALDDFAGGNRYPRGRIGVEVPPNEAGLAPMCRTIETNGRSTLQELSEGFGWASLGFAAAGVVAAVVPGLQPLAPVLFVAAAGTGAVSGGTSIVDELRQARPNGMRIAIDAVSVASAMLGFAGAGRAVLSGTAVVWDDATRFLLVNAARADVASMLLVSVDGVSQINAILSSNLDETGKLSAIARVLAVLAANGTLIVVQTRQMNFQTRGMTFDRVSDVPGGDRMVQELMRTGMSQERAIQIATQWLRSGSTPPTTRTAGADEVLYKVVPAGESVSTYSPYWMTQSELDALVAQPSLIADRLALPQGSNAWSFDVYAIRPQGGQTPVVFESTTAPATSGFTEYRGGSTQTIVPDRSQWTPPDLQRTISAAPWSGR